MAQSPQQLALLSAIMDHPDGLDALDQLRERSPAGLATLARQRTRLPWARQALLSPAENVRCLGLFALLSGADRRYPAVVLHVRRPEDARYPERVATIALYPVLRGGDRGWRIAEDATGHIVWSQAVGGAEGDPDHFTAEEAWPAPAELTPTSSGSSPAPPPSGSSGS